MEEEKVYQGAFDPRTPEEKQTDYHIREAVAAANPVNWRELKPSEIRVFGEQDQDGQLSCVAQTRRKLRRIIFKVNKNLDVDFSALHLYRRRSNYPDGGMAAMDAIGLDRKQGMTLNALIPSDKLSEAQANNIIIEPYNDEVAKIFLVPNEIILTPGDLETAASSIQTTRKGLMLWFFFTTAEWSREVVEILDPNLDLYGQRTSRHSVTGIEPAIYKGMKGMWVDDSAHFGGLSRRFVPEKFYKARNYWASYPVDLKYGSQKEEPGVTKPRHTFTKPLVFIPLDEKGNITNVELHNRQDSDVRKLQDILRYEGFFPQQYQSTGYYGSVTAKAVDAYQRKYNVAPVAELDALKGRRFGEKSINDINSKYGVL